MKEIIKISLCIFSEPFYLFFSCPWIAYNSTHQCCVVLYAAAAAVVTHSA